MLHMLHDMRLVVKAGDAFKVERATATLWKGSFEEIGVFHLRRSENARVPFFI